MNYAFNRIFIFRINSKTLKYSKVQKGMEESKIKNKNRIKILIDLIMLQVIFNSLVFG